MDYCQNCIWKQKKSLPSECPECGAKTLYSTLDGPCLSLKCINCGFEIVGASFFPQCHLDEDRYTISINTAEKAQYLKAAKVFNINTVQLKHYLDSGKTVTRSDLSLDNAINLIRKLKAADLQYQIEPDPLTKYHDILHCTLR